MGTPCIWLEPTDLAKRYLRRYRLVQGETCPAPLGYHNAMVYIDLTPLRWNADHTYSMDEPGDDVEFVEDARWPKSCECGYVFVKADQWQVFREAVYLASDGRSFTLHEAPTGAMYDAKWMSWKGDDGRCIALKLPDGQFWLVDGPASNCTKPGDKEHHCWIRHGVPPMLTVDKDGKTCGAGGGSIQTAKWHGFLRNGELVE